MNAVIDIEPIINDEGHLSHETEIFRIVLKNNVLYGTYKVGPVDLEMAKDIVADRLAFQAGQSYPLIVQQENVKGLDKEARTYLSGEEGVRGITACAIVARSNYIKFLANFFLKVSVKSPPFPVRIVGSLEDAERWIEPYVEK